MTAEMRRSSVDGRGAGDQSMGRTQGDMLVTQGLKENRQVKKEEKTRI